MQLKQEKKKVQAEDREEFDLRFKAWQLKLERLVEAGKCDSK